MILEPSKEILDDLKNALDISLPLYINYAYKFGDCADTLAQLLTKRSKIIKWEVCPWDSNKAVLPYIQSANISLNGQINIILDAETIEDDILDVEEFTKYATHAAQHEGVHLRQREIAGDDYWFNHTSGWNKMQEYYYYSCSQPDPTHEELKTGMRIYFSDPLEIMAHAKDLSIEILYADEPLVALRDPEGFIDYLPTWYRFRRAGFLRSDPVMRHLLKYTYNYVILALNPDK